MTTVDRNELKHKLISRLKENPNCDLDPDDVASEFGVRRSVAVRVMSEIMAMSVLTNPKKWVDRFAGGDFGLTVDGLREPEEELTVCPKCGNKAVRAKSLQEGGGVECTVEGCGYWFCY